MKSRRTRACARGAISSPNSRSTNRLASLEAAIEIDRGDQAPRTYRRAAPACGARPSFPLPARAARARRGRSARPGARARPSTRAWPSPWTSVPRGSCGNSRNSMSATTRPSTASPRNSSDSLSKTPPLASSCARDLCVSACSSEPAIAEPVIDPLLERFEFAAGSGRRRATGASARCDAINRCDSSADSGGTDRRRSLSPSSAQRKDRRAHTRSADDRDAVRLEQPADDPRPRSRRTYER